MERLARLAPHVNLVVRGGPVGLERLAQGSLDLVIRPATALAPGFHTEDVLTEKFVCLLRKGRPLAVITLGARMARTYAALLPLVVVPAPLELPLLTMSMLWHETHTHDPALVWLREQVRTVLQPARRSPRA